MPADHSFQMRPHDYGGPGCEIFYEEPGYKLEISFDGSGVPQFDFGCDDAQFQKWTEPAGEPIPKEKQEEIIGRLRYWARKEKGLRLDIGPGIDMKAFFEEQEKMGFKVERRPDGTVVVSHPQRKT
jgi:hypothetical protein